MSLFLEGVSKVVNGQTAYPSDRFLTAVRHTMKRAALGRHLRVKDIPDCGLMRAGWPNTAKCLERSGCDRHARARPRGLPMVYFSSSSTTIDGPFTTISLARCGCWASPRARSGQWPCARAADLMQLTPMWTASRLSYRAASNNAVPLARAWSRTQGLVLAGRTAGKLRL